MDARATIQDYYDALRDGRPLGLYFAGARDSDDQPVKFGISETLVGRDAIEAGLREQTATTTDWAVDSRALRVTERPEHAWFSDAIGLSWTDTERGIRFEFETRWSGTLERREAGSGTAPAWQFVGLHVSTADGL